MLKKSRLIVSLSLLVQSFTLFILFLILCVKKRSIAAAFLGVSAMEGAAGLYLFKQAADELEDNDFNPGDYLVDDFDGFDDFDDTDDDDGDHVSEADIRSELSREEDEGAAPREIPLEEEVSEDEFKNH